MVFLRFFLVLMLAFTVGGCDTTGGTIGGLLPAPKFLKGDIKNNIYTAKDKLFSVGVPHKDGSYEYTYMQIKEQYSKTDDYVSFGPAAFDKTVYRVEIARRMVPEGQGISFDDAAPKIVENYELQFQKAIGTMPTLIEQKQEEVNGRKTYYWKLSQVVPAGKFLSNKADTFTHYAYVIDFGKAAAIVWVQIPESMHKIDMEPQVFAESLTIY